MSRDAPYLSARRCIFANFFNVRWMLRLGVVVTILTIAIDPFSQQLVQIEQNMRYVNEMNGNKATSPYAYNYTLGNFEYDDETSLTARIVFAEPHFSMEISMLSGLSRQVETIRQQSTSRCPTGNCTWDEFETLGVCSRCADVTPDLTRVDNFTDFLNLAESMRVDDLGFGMSLGENGSANILPNGHFLANFAGSLAEAGRDVPVWKNHSLAAVSQGTHLMVAELIGDARTTKDMEGSAGKGAVKMAVAEKTPLLDASDADGETLEENHHEQ